MNLILLLQQDFINQYQVRISGRRFNHLKNILQAKIGDQFTVGLLNNDIGIGSIQSISNTDLVMSVDLHRSPPPPLSLTLALALPRPMMLKRILQTCAAMGVKKLILFSSKRVEKSFWQTPLLAEEAVKENFILGLEQAKDTHLPELILEKHFKSFVEDRLAEICKKKLSFVAHPNSDQSCPSVHRRDTVLVIGPEGGFVDYEVQKFVNAGCQPVHIGERILRVETAVPVLLAKLFH